MVISSISSSYRTFNISYVTRGPLHVIFNSPCPQHYYGPTCKGSPIGSILCYGLGGGFILVAQSVVVSNY